MFYRARRTSEYMALSLFLGMILLFLQSFLVTAVFIPNEYLRVLASGLFSVLRLGAPALLFMHMQKISGAEKLKIGKNPECSVKYNITLAFAGFAFIFIFGLLYAAAFPSAAVAFEDTDLPSALITVLCSALVPAVFEEYLYRKIFCTELTVHGGAFAIIISALLFALAHFSFYTFPYAFICGLVLGVVYIKTGSVRYTVAVHFANNFLGYVCAFVSTKMNALDYANVMMVLMLALGVMALGACYTILPGKQKPSPAENGNVASSAFLTFPMVVYIFCAVLMNFI
ncbi:MAG: CPBP family intramembrane metalloprotease [Clostridia bacterium]|nr:CPBP family intramembrane metalloprotease [Clostridia bacterium]